MCSETDTVVQYTRLMLRVHSLWIALVTLEKDCSVGIGNILSLAERALRLDPSAAPVEIPAACGALLAGLHAAVFNPPFKRGELRQALTRCGWLKHDKRHMLLQSFLFFGYPPRHLLGSLPGGRPAVYRLFVTFCNLLESLSSLYCLHNDLFVICSSQVPAVALP